MGSRWRLVAAACLVASGLLVGGAGGALAIAGPAHESGDTGQAPTSDSRSDAQDGEDESRQGTPGEGKRDEVTPADGKPAQTPDDPTEGPDEDERDDTRPTPTREPKPTQTPKPTETEEPPTEEPAEPGNCEEEAGDDCTFAPPSARLEVPPAIQLPPAAPVAPPEAGGGGGGGATFEPPSGRPKAPPSMQVPPHVGVDADPTEPAVVNAAPGVDLPEAELAPITMPVIAAPPAPLGSGGAPSAPAAPIPGAPRGINAEPPAGRPSPPAVVRGNATVPASSYRRGYNEYLRTARLSQLLALAVPGVAGMLVLTAVGGMAGYRQAKAGHAVRTGRNSRFVK